MTFQSYMDIALSEARAAAARGEVPVGAVIVSPAGDIIAQAG
ncbi:MAG: nucleoside deaminase, partial [Paracoccaceae bacterium]